MLLIIAAFGIGVVVPLELDAGCRSKLGGLSFVDGQIQCDNAIAPAGISEGVSVGPACGVCFSALSILVAVNDCIFEYGVHN